MEQDGVGSLGVHGWEFGVCGLRLVASALLTRVCGAVLEMRGLCGLCVVVVVWTVVGMGMWGVEGEQIQKIDRTIAGVTTSAVFGTSVAMSSDGAALVRKCVCVGGEEEERGWEGRVG